MTKRKAPAQIEVCLYCGGIWTEDERVRTLEPGEVKSKTISGVSYLMCVCCDKAMKTYNRAEAL